MNKLLSANFIRLWRDKSFRIIAAIVLIASFSVVLNSGYRAVETIASGITVTSDAFFFNHAPFMGLYYASFVSLFLGVEYSDGTIRNKLVVGHRRRDIYLANFITCFVAGIFLLLLWWIGSLPGIIMVGKFEMGFVGFVRYALIAVGFTSAFASIFTLVGSLTTNKAMTVVFTLLTWIGLLVTAAAIYDTICSPYIDNGTIKTALECVLDFLPTGQAMLMSDTSITHPVRQLVCSAIFTALVTAIGLSAFHKKDLK